MQKHIATTAALTLALATMAGAAHAGQSSKLGVSAAVVPSMRLLVSSRPTMLAAASLPVAAPGTAGSVRTVAAPGGTFYVVGFDVGVNGEAAPGEVALNIRTDDGEAAPAIRYHAGRGGAWNRAGYGVAVPAGAPGAVQVARGQTQGGEIGVFVAKGAQARQAFVVVTVQADRARL